MIVNRVPLIAYSWHRYTSCVPLVTAILTRTVRCFTRLPGSWLLATVGVAHGVAALPAGGSPVGGAVGRGTVPPQPNRPAGQASPESRVRAPVSLIRETGTGSRASRSFGRAPLVCFEEQIG
jgi:hypothetical protein